MLDKYTDRLLPYWSCNYVMKSRKYARNNKEITFSVCKIIIQNRISRENIVLQHENINNFDNETQKGCQYHVISVLAPYLVRLCLFWFHIWKDILVLAPYLRRYLGFGSIFDKISRFWHQISVKYDPMMTQSIVLFSLHTILLMTVF